MEIQLAQIETRNKELNGDLESMKSLKRLTARLQQMHSNLVQWGDPTANWVMMEQNPHARVVPMGTSPRPVINFDSSVVTAVPKGGN